MKSSLILGENLCDLGIISPDIAKDEAKLQAACSEFCPHHVAHYLGMDVHDTGKYLMCRSLVSMGSMGLAEPINFQRWVLEPIDS